MSFGFAPRAASAYAKVSLETGVSDADPHRLILMLFDGALFSIATASAAIERNDIPGKGQAISKAIEIINDGLKISLDYEAGGELAERLGALYDYMTSRLIYANIHSSRPTLDEVGGLLRDIKGAWESIGTQV